VIGCTAPTSCWAAAGSRIFPRRIASEGPPLESPRFHRKDRQLCRQVLRRLELSLLELEDPALSEIQIVEVVPAPDASRLRVVVAALRPVDRAGREAVVLALARAEPRLRGAVAQEIARRRVPELVFLLSAGEVR
jgi:ribosome-binding factor A